ncbi:MAG: hypothetical protein KGI33_06000 [Thaumarchaeota archaeon]|nr:hypothetical protein [Nitrososphaerota archaeon]
MENPRYVKDVLNQVATEKHLVIILGIIGLVILAINLEGTGTSILVGNLLYVPVTFFMVISSYLLLKKQRKIGDRDMGWILFFGSAVSWLLAEHTWMITELVLHGKTFPSAADFFYIGGYILLGIFIFRMLWPLKNYTTFNVKLGATLVVSIFLVPSIYMAYSSGGEGVLSIALSLAYPIMDGILLWPGIIVLSSSSKLGKSKKFWSFLAVGIISMLVGDTMFSIATALGFYHTGYPFEIFFYSAYVMIGYSALVRRKQSLAHSPLIEEVKAEFEEIRRKGFASHWKIVSFLSIASVVAFCILMFETPVEQNLSTRELEVVTPAGYILSALVVVLGLAFMVTLQKNRTMHAKINGLETHTYERKGESGTETSIETMVRAIGRLDRRRNELLPFWVAFLVILTVVSTYVITSNVSEVTSGNQVIQSGRFIIQNLQGANITAWATWHKGPGEPLHVTIVNSNLVASAKIQAIKDAILSEDTTLGNGGGVKPPGGNVIYYKGWKGAIESIARQNASVSLPTNFEIVQGQESIGDVVIILTTDVEGDGALGFTKTIADTDHHQILKSFITIFDAKDLTAKEMGAITRHEFGHALGLSHLPVTGDLMNKQFVASRAYISPCDLDDLKSLYSGIGPDTTCS